MVAFQRRSQTRAWRGDIFAGLQSGGLYRLGRAYPEVDLLDLHGRQTNKAD